MTRTLSQTDRLEGALIGMFIADALAMPVHWYYDTLALVRDYGRVTDYLQPKNPHPDSILHRSSYTPPNRSADILHDQAKYWGKKDIHYHQFLKAGENTLNLKLARELILHLDSGEEYSTEKWLERMTVFLTTPGTHNDTYVEEYLREFFINRSKGLPLTECGRKNEKHIGGFSLMLPILITSGDSPNHDIEPALRHLALTHGGDGMHRWGSFIGLLFFALLKGEPMSAAVREAAKNSDVNLNIDDLESLLDYPDNTVVGMHYSSACYVDYAVPATLYLALKYQDNPEEGLIANTMCGGDNCGRGAVLGALLGAVNGLDGWPSRWLNGLLHPPPKRGAVKICS
ncbi:MAG: ADP-ribosylglycohydrolase family protein [Desulfocapsaceae bacterium]|nr:ADP-ribosylglycohydrolase family protein [Desulfocapsaceae bacterium]